jgi:hypothetical protein
VIAMNKKGDKVKIIWQDTKMFSPKNKHIELSTMETVGFFENEYDDYLLVKNIETKNIKTGKKHPKQDPYFYLIPKGMVEKIKTI